MIKLPHEVIGRAIADADFRKRLLADPAGTLKDAGISVDDDTIKQLEALDPATVEKMVAAAGDELGEAAAG
jgi:hypothetical protein